MFATWQEHLPELIRTSHSSPIEHKAGSFEPGELMTSNSSPIKHKAGCFEAGELVTSNSSTIEHKVRCFEPGELFGLRSSSLSHYAQQLLVGGGCVPVMPSGCSCIPAALHVAASARLGQGLASERAARRCVRVLPHGDGRGSVPATRRNRPEMSIGQARATSEEVSAPFGQGATRCSNRKKGAGKIKQPWVQHVADQVIEVVE